MHAKDPEPMAEFDLEEVKQEIQAEEDIEPEVVQEEEKTQTCSDKLRALTGSKDNQRSKLAAVKPEKQG